MARISLEQLAFRYPGAADETIRGLDLDIANGEAHALLGASGAGKTTLLNLLSGLLAPTGGRLMFDGEDRSRASGRDRNVAQVFQFPVLYDSLTVAENLAFPLKVRGASTAAIKQRIDTISAELEIDQLRSRKPASLSLFEKQLVAVGKALVRPDVSMVLLDEPLTAVEPKVKWRLRQTLRKVQADLGVTMVYVTHDQTEALTFADRVSVLADGRILQTGTPDEVYAAPEHEFVGHFVGSPGMNFLPADALGVTNGERVGFRPEWARLGDSGATAGTIVGTVSRLRTLGSRDGRPWGIVMLDTDHGELAVRGPIDPDEQKPGTRTSLSVDQFVTFKDQRRVNTNERV